MLQHRFRGGHCLCPVVCHISHFCSSETPLRVPASIPASPRLQVGGALVISGRTFVLEDADEATLKAMAADPATFPFADARQVGRHAMGGAFKVSRLD